MSGISSCQRKESYRVLPKLNARGRVVLSLFFSFRLVHFSGCSAGETGVLGDSGCLECFLSAHSVAVWVVCFAQNIRL